MTIQNSGHAPTQPRESAIIATLPPGNYAAIVRGVNNTVGVGLVEAYDISPNANSILGNISTRGFVQTGDNVMIGGFIIEGTGPKTVIVRAIGPELSAPPFNIPNALANPTLELHNGNGALIARNDNWQTTIIDGIITQNQVKEIQNSGHTPTQAERICDHCYATTGQLHRDRAWCKQHHRCCSRGSVRSALRFLSAKQASLANCFRYRPMRWTRKRCGSAFGRCAPRRY